MLHSFITGLDLSKPSNPDFIAMVARRNCHAEFSYVLLNLFSLNVQKSAYWRISYMIPVLESLMHDSCVKKYLGASSGSNLSLFFQNVSVECPDPMLLVNLEYFIVKNEMQNSINIRPRRNRTLPTMTAFKEIM